VVAVGTISVQKGELALADSAARLVLTRIGACVGLVIYDPDAKIAGCAHVLLPHANGKPEPSREGRYADTAAQCLVSRMASNGANPDRLVSALVGGGSMLGVEQSGLATADFGSRTVSVLRDELARLGIPCIGADVGGHEVRSLQVAASTGEVYVSRDGGESRLLCNLRGEGF
jgi:chemotaxis protein CheD